jgi:hypothetical protein
MSNSNHVGGWTKAFFWALGVSLTWHLLLAPLIWFPSLKGVPTDAAGIANWSLEQAFVTSCRISEVASIAWLLFPRHSAPRISLTWSALLLTGASITAHALNSDSLSEFQNEMIFKVPSPCHKSPLGIHMDTPFPPPRKVLITK